MGQTGAVAMLGLSTGFSAMSKSKAGSAQADVLNWNAGLEDWRAEDAIQRGKVDADKMRRLTKATIGHEKAVQAAHGVDVNKGSAVDVRGDMAYLGELDALTIENNAYRESFGYKVQAYDYRTKAGLTEQEGTTAAIGTVLGSASSLLMAKYIK